MHILFYLFTFTHTSQLYPFNTYRRLPYDLKKNSTKEIIRLTNPSFEFKREFMVIAQLCINIIKICETEYNNRLEIIDNSLVAYGMYLDMYSAMQDIRELCGGPGVMFVGSTDYLIEDLTVVVYKVFSNFLNNTRSIVLENSDGF